MLVRYFVAQDLSDAFLTIRPWGYVLLGRKTTEVKVSSYHIEGACCHHDLSNNVKDAGLDHLAEAISLLVLKLVGKACLI